MLCIQTNTVGARLGIYPMHDAFVDTILGAVRATDRKGLWVGTDDLGTTIQGSEDRVFEYVEEVFVRAAAYGGHIVANITFSGGWPGDQQENIEFDVPTQSSPRPDNSFPVACSWALYPMGTPEYMRVIENEIASTLNESKVFAGRLHYASRIDGAAHEVFATLQKAFQAVRQHVTHTVIHATISAGSPSTPRQQIKL